MENNSNYDITKLDDTFSKLEEIVEKVSSKIQKNDEGDSSTYGVIKEKISTLDHTHEKDLCLIRKDITDLSEDVSDLAEKCQEMRGEINQLKMFYDNLKDQLDDKKNSKSNFINNVIWPVLVIVIAAVLGFCCTNILKINENNNCPYHNIQHQQHNGTE